MVIYNTEDAKIPDNAFDELFSSNTVCSNSPTAYFLGCYADGQFWDEIGERLPKDVTVTHWMAFPMV